MARELRIADIKEQNQPIEERHYAPTEDRVLWQSFKEGSESAFITIYKQYFQVLYNYGMQLCGDRNLIMDCIQDTFITLRSSRRGIADVTSIKAYLLKVVRRRIMKEIGKSNRRNELTMEGMDFQIVPSSESLIIDRQFKSDQLKQIKNALNKLSIRQREAIYYYYYNDLSYKEIKEIMDFSSVEAARNLIYRALTAVRKML